MERTTTTMGKWRRHKREFKRQAVERMKTCDNIQGLARELQLEPKLLYVWKHQFEGRPEPRHASFVETPEESTERKLREEIARLKQALADRSLEIDFFKGALRRIEEGRPSKSSTGDPASMPKSGSRRTRKAD
jgi:transposase-like protein